VRERFNFVFSVEEKSSLLWRAVIFANKVLEDLFTCLDLCIVDFFCGVIVHAQGLVAIAACGCELLTGISHATAGSESCEEPKAKLSGGAHGFSSWGEAMV
jgi:hypothetical protein